MPLHIVDHPLVRHKLGLLRRNGTPVNQFRALTKEITKLLVYEATKKLPTEKKTIQGWAGPVEVDRIKGKKITVVPVLRAGIGMLDGFLDMIPSAKVSVIGMFRSEDTLEPVQYYAKLAKEMSDRSAVILDPMLATGGTMNATVDILKKAGCKDIRGIFLVVSPEGVEKVLREHPDVDIFASSLDERLNHQGYILPGLGDAGDKIFGTK